MFLFTNTSWFRYTHILLKKHTMDQMDNFSKNTQLQRSATIVEQARISALQI